MEDWGEFLIWLVLAVGLWFWGDSLPDINSPRGVGFCLALLIGFLFYLICKLFDQFDSRIDQRINKAKQDILDEIAYKLNLIEIDISSIQSDVSSTESDVSSIQSDVSSIQSDVSSIESDVNSKEEEDAFDDVY